MCFWVMRHELGLFLLMSIMLGWTGQEWLNLSENRGSQFGRVQFFEASLKSPQERPLT